MLMIRISCFKLRLTMLSRQTSTADLSAVSELSCFAIEVTIGKSKTYRPKSQVLIKF